MTPRLSNQQSGYYNDYTITAPVSYEEQYQFLRIINIFLTCRSYAECRPIAPSLNVSYFWNVCISYSHFNNIYGHASARGTVLCTRCSQ
jgi:hypothetical protein